MGLFSVTRASSRPRRIAASRSENDGYAYFAPDKLPYAYDVNLSLILINLTLAAVSQSAGAAGLPVFGLSSSM